jgi:hypothetical protein
VKGPTLERVHHIWIVTTLVNTTNLAMIKGIINAICSPGKAQRTTSKELPKHPKTPELEKLLTVGNADIQ